MTPHGFCLLWDRPLVATHVVADSLVALSYFAIPVVLFKARRVLTDAVGQLIVALFALFIVACGVTHVMDVVVLWHPLYWLQATVKLVTATLSVWTAVFVVSLMRR